MSEPMSGPGSRGGFDEEERRKRSFKGPLAWMARNSVAANLLMLVLIVGGLLLIPRIKQEVFPEFDLDLITIEAVYPGASPAEVEQAVVLAVEESVRGIDGVKEVRSIAGEGIAFVSVELLLGSNGPKVLSDVKSAVDRVSSFPRDVERPIVSLATIRNQVISLVLYGDVDEAALKALAERARDDLLQDPRITTVELAGVRPIEVSIEVPQDKLRQYSLTLSQIAAAIQAASVELPGGALKTASGEVLLRTTERRSRGEEFGDIVLVSRPDGTRVRVRDVADVVDGFRETDEEATFNGKRAAMVQVFRVGEQTPLEISAAVFEYVERIRPTLPPGVEAATWGDRAEIYRDRVDLLLRNAYLGLALVLLSLGLFLEVRLAFWVTLGIPISFIGAMLFMPAMDVSLNMISLFAFIVTLGIVVDDAIVVGEAIYKRRQDGMPYMEAAIAGLRDVFGPVVFSVLTTVIAFMPLLFVPGIMGKFFRVIPIIVIIVLMISLVESILILPAHLGHGRPPAARGFFAWVDRQQGRFGRALEWWIARVYAPSLDVALRRRYLTLSVCVAMLIGAVGLVAGGRVRTTFFPKIDGDIVSAELRMPFGTSVDVTRAAHRRLIEAAQDVLRESGGGARIDRGMFARLGAVSGGGNSIAASSGGHVAEVSVSLVSSDKRPVTASQLAQRWRERMGDVPGVDALTFNYSTGASGGAPIDVELSHTRMDVLESAARRVAASLKDFAGLRDIDDGFSAGKEQLDLRLRPEARSLGITEAELARQVRSAFFGAEAVRQQRGRDELRVYVRFPEHERRSLSHVEGMMIRTPEGGEIPLDVAATVTRGRSYTEIKRTNGRRVVNVTADTVPGVANENEVVGELAATVLPGVLREYPGLRYEFGGGQKQQAEAMAALKIGFLMALLAMFALMAIPLRSYVQPVIIMSAIPFGIIGAVIGHMIFGYDLSLMSMMGFVALSGVVVNDSLVMTSAVNEYRAGGMTIDEAVRAGGTRRFRPILLTSLTTFFGLMPMILEPSVQARFLVPMALSLGCGVMFATFITLMLVPSLYLILDDFRRAVARVRAWLGWSAPEEPAAAAAEPGSIPEPRP